MGLKQRTSTGVYLKLKDGKFYLASNKEENAEGFDELEGKLVDMYFRDETYEGQEQRKLYLVMNDGDTNYIVGFRFDSRYISDFIKFAKNIDLKEVFTLCPTSKEKKNAKGEDVKENGLLIKQDGSFAKAYYSKDKPNGLPQMKQVKVNGKLVWDKGEVLDFYENVIEKDFKPQLPKQSAPAKTVIHSEDTVDEPTLVDTSVDDADDAEEGGKLPWE